MELHQISATHTMSEMLRIEGADFLAVARPLICEFDLVRQLAQLRAGRLGCTSRNLCLTHEGRHSLRCR